MRDLYVLRLLGKRTNGRLDSTLIPVAPPSFKEEPFEHGMDSMIRLTRDVWK